MKLFKVFLFLLIIMNVVACGSDNPSDNKKEIITVTSQSQTAPLYYAGIIQPLKTKVVTSPADGVIQEMFFHYGDQVKAGQLLFTISSEKFQMDYKNALMQYIKSKNEFNTGHSQLLQSQFLHKNQLISDDEFHAKQSSFYNAQLALVQAKEVLNGMLKQLTVQGFNIEDLTIENIDKITQALHAQGDSQKLRIVALEAGVVLLPNKSDSAESETKKISKGDQVKQGDVLAVIGDTAGLSLRVNVNEFNINQLKEGQKVKVTGAAFPDVLLDGYIAGLDKQAQISSGGLPVFPIEVVVPKLSAKDQKNIHIGMSAKVEININGESKIMVPLAAVKEKNGSTFVDRQDPETGKIQELLVRTGPTTADSVTIESNLIPGDKIVVTR